MWFHLTAAGRLLARRRGPVARMVLVAWIGTLWCLVGGVWTLATFRTVQREAESIQIDVLLRPTTTDADARAMARDIASWRAVRDVEFLREQEVWQEFSGDVAIDDHLRSVVAMPRIVRFWLRAHAATPKNIEAKAARLERRYSDRVEQVVWSEAYARVVAERRRDVAMLGSVAGILSLLFVIIALMYAFRAELHAAGGDLRVGALLGARASWIAMPHFLVSMIAGALGVLLALGVLAIAVPSLHDRLPWMDTVHLSDVVFFVLILAVLGILAGWWQSLMAGRRAVRHAAV